jgi:hypothetical protein
MTDTTATPAPKLSLTEKVRGFAQRNKSELTMVTIAAAGVVATKYAVRSELAKTVVHLSIVPELYAVAEDIVDEAVNLATEAVTS